MKGIHGHRREDNVWSNHGFGWCGRMFDDAIDCQ